MRTLWIFCILLCGIYPVNAILPSDEVHKAYAQANVSNIDQAVWASKVLTGKHLFSEKNLKKLQTKNGDEGFWKCVGDLTKLSQAVENEEPYALMVMDAQGRVPSGVSQGNFLWLGAYQQCEDTRNGTFQAEYCLAHVNLAPGVQLKIGLCVPDTCGPNEVSGLLILAIIEGGGDPEALLPYALCGATEEFEPVDIVVLTLCVLLGILIVLGTLYDAIARLQGRTITKPGVLISFSVIKNGEKLIDTTIRSKSLACLNGIRVISTSWVVLGHCLVFMLGYMDNIMQVVAKTRTWSYQMLINATVSVDTFFFMSGFLVATLTLRELDKRTSKGLVASAKFWGLFYFHRFWRLTPVYMFLLVIWTTLWRYMPSGPMEAYAPYASANCKDVWWQNLLYINNFWINQCFGWAWYLANDMQFYVISPIFLYAMHKHWKAGIALVTGLILMDLITTGVVATTYGVQYYPVPGPNPVQETHIYNKPYYRIAPYAVGMLLALLIHRTKGKVTLPKVIVILGWIIAAAINLAVIFGPYPSHRDQKPFANQHIDSLYISSHRFAWSLGLAWVTFACICGYGGPVNTLLSWSVWLPLGRLSYVVYLVHEMFIFGYSFSIRVPFHYTDINLAMFFIATLVICYLVSFVISLAVEAPMMQLEKVFLPQKKSVPKVEKTAEPGDHESHLPTVIPPSNININNGIVNAQFMDDKDTPLSQHLAYRPKEISSSHM